jgi:predicted O-linked N-acetylglucosamine transferase (SPINDLY family)
MARPIVNPRAPRVNDPCPCGSGRKYKHCHGAPARANVAPAVAAPVSTTALLALAQQAVAAGRLPQAQDAYLVVLERDARSYDALSGMGQLAERAGDTEAAAHYYATLVDAHPDDARAHFALGNFFTRQYEFPRARSCYRRVVEIDPAAAGAWNNLGNVEKYLGNLRESIACYDRSVACDPDNATLHSNALISLYYDTSTSHEELFARHQAWAQRHAACYYPRGRSWPNRKDPSRRLRVGYVSGSLDGRVLGHFLRHVFPYHDRAQLTSYAYSGTRHADEMTKELASAFDHWRDIGTLDDNTVAAQVERDGIDVLVDLDGHTPDARLLVFARKPAPVQITWLGYWNTTGMTTVDYILTDPHTTPPHCPQRFTERALHLAESRFCYAPVPYAPEVAPLPSLVRDVFTFGSFNRYDKLGPELIGCWCEILRRVPASRLVIKNSAIAVPHAREELSRRFAAHGIAQQRIDLRARSPHAAMLAEYGDVDLGLDTFPYNGGLTTCEALWMGVPMVAQEEERMISRQTAAMLRLVGAAEFVAGTRDEYVELAAHWAQQRERLAGVRAALRERMRTSALCDGARFTRHLETALRSAWQRYCAAAPARESGSG